jgi:thiamine-monophosphate kinase
MRDKLFFKSEADFIASIYRRNPRRVVGLTLGIGDDAALVKVPPGQEVILTSDMSIEDVHFISDLHPPRAIGHRALARSLSDIAAMGGTPRYALVSLAISRSIGRTWLEGFFGGLFALARRFDTVVIGGDTSVVEGPTMVDVVLAGLIPRGRAVRRSGANPGDRIFVSGRLGMAALGLRVLTSKRPPRNAVEKAALRAHLFPQPQCALGRFLSEHGLATSMMDISDGLSIDLQRLCKASGVGAELLANQIPTPAIPDPDDPFELALNGGEDYQLLFTVPAAKVSLIPRRFRNIPLHNIGQIRASRGINITEPSGATRALEPRGYDHFTHRAQSRS